MFGVTKLGARKTTTVDDRFLEEYEKNFQLRTIFAQTRAGRAGEKSTSHL